ncbi:hypothetical protein [Agreia sp. COWG]|uniref:hypothetical protein n=1 Tax=Agreia sp. COWG TaxID=2773266 RepID=UPI001928FC47|nr:hypothetical protein [Agreia sp. COWG]CAD5991264.1 protein of unknown function [Agreia sp. COWG]
MEIISVVAPYAAGAFAWLALGSILAIGFGRVIRNRDAEPASPLEATAFAQESALTR